MKNLVTALLLTAASSVWADESCNLELHKGLRITKEAIEVSEGDKALYKIVKDKSLWVDGRELHLDATQQAALTQYSISLRKMVPEARALALDAIDISSAVVLVMFDKVTDPDANARTKLRGEFASMKAEVEKKYADGMPVYFNEKDGNQNILDDLFSSHLNNIMQSVGEEFAFGLMKKMGGILLSPDSTKEFENQMESFGKKMETVMERRSKTLEQHARSFCSAATALDVQEEQLRHSVKALGQIDVITVTKNKKLTGHEQHNGTEPNESEPNASE